MKDFEINDSDILAKIHLEIGLCSVHSFKLIKAINHFKTALVIYEGLNWKLDIARCLNKLAFVHSLISTDYENAKKLCYEALAIYRHKLNNNDLRICETYHTLGNIFFMEKDYEMALEYLKRSLTGKKDLFGDKHICMVKTLNLLGMTCHLMENLKQSADYYEEAVLIFGSELHLSYAQVLNNLGLVYLEQRKVKSGTFAFQQALDIA